MIVRPSLWGATIAALSSMATVSPKPSLDLAPVAKLFAPGVISGPGNDGSPTFTPDGRSLFFERSNGSWSTIVESRRTRSGWGVPRLAPFVDGWSSQQPALSPDGHYLVFVSIRPDSTLGGEHTSAHLYRVEREPQGWSQPRELPRTVNISRRVFKPSIAANGDLYFMADAGSDVSAPPRWRLYRSRRSGENYLPAEPLDFSGGAYADVDPFVAPDQRYLIFSSRDRPPFVDHHEHLYISCADEGTWGQPHPLRYRGDEGADDGEAQVDPEGRTVYFTSGRVQRAAVGESPWNVHRQFHDMETWNNGNGNVWTIPLPAAAQTGCPSLPGTKM